VVDIVQPLLAWYDRHRRVLPWRAPPGKRASAYHVWLSEIMLQQTTVAAVGPYYRRFLARWPTVGALANAPVEEVMREWAGLGYYARARNLHACAQAITEGGGRFPETEQGLLELPGIGPYTAAAIAAIAFDLPTTPVDGNWERVVARLHAVTEPLPGSKPKLRALAAKLTPRLRPGDFAQAMMDLGATVCTPRSPACTVCPLIASCAARAQGSAETLPARSPKRERPMRHGVAFWLTRGDQVWLRRRPPKGLLGGLLEVPSTEWRRTPWTVGEAERAAPLMLDWRPCARLAEHGFTHFELQLQVWVAALGRADAAPDGEWVRLDDLSVAGLPSAMKKVVDVALDREAAPRYASAAS
jgi:A/G-specific adenine glycosylase